MPEVEGTGEPIYLELADALELYAAIIGSTSAQAADQLRDQGALEGALGRPRSYANYEDADLGLLVVVAAAIWDFVNDVPARPLKRAKRSFCLALALDAIAPPLDIARRGLPKGGPQGEESSCDESS